MYVGSELEHDYYAGIALYMHRDRLQLITLKKGIGG